MNHARRGRNHADRQDYDRAIADYSEALRLSPGLAVALNARGGAFLLKRDYERALADFDATVRIAPTVVAHWTSRGTAKLRMGRFDEALSDFEEAVRLDPNFVIGYVGRGASYREKGDHAQAQVNLDKALSIDPAQPRALYHRGMVFAAKGETARALDDLRRAAAIDPKDADVQQALARLADGAAPAPSSPGRRVALVIGNGDYKHSSKLNNPDNDATDVASTLRRLGFDVIEGRNLDKRAMEDKVREFGRKLDRADLALFFYAGHGLQVGGKNYLVPIDARLERPGDLAFEAIDVSQVLGQIEAEQRVNLLFLDACRDNPLARSFARSLGTRSTSVGQGLATIQSAVGTLIAYATQPDNVALDGDGRNSPFTTALLKHLATPGLEIGGMMRRVRADVIQATRNRQVPWDHSSLVGDVILVR